MKPLPQIRSVKESHEDRLLKLPGVTGVDIGPKLVAGQKTDETVIRVYVEKKKKNVPADQLVPPEIDGVKTDVIERRFVLHASSTATVEPRAVMENRAPVGVLRPMADTASYDPLLGGISIGPCSAVGGFVYVGTLGCLVKDRATSEHLMLTNYHVIAEKWPVNATIAQPSRVDGGTCPAKVVGSLLRSVISERVDGAVAKITARGKKCAIHEIGDVKGKAAAAVDMAVRKRGRTSGLTHGLVESIDATVNVPYDHGTQTLKHQILINVDTARSSVFGQSGDSGSVVVDANNKVVGLYFAGTEDGSIGVANPIDSVLDELNVDLCIGGLSKLPIEKSPVIEKFIREKTWWREIFKDRYKEVAYDKPPFVEGIDWGFDWRVNPPFEQPIDVPGVGPRDESGSAAPSSMVEERLQRLESLLAQAGESTAQSQAETMQPHLLPALQTCSDFRPLPPGFGANPRALNGATFRVFSHTGAPTPQTRIVNWGVLPGLDAGFRTSVTHPATNQVRVTLVRWATAPTLTAFNASNVAVATATMSVAQGVEETVTLNGAGIVRVEIRSLQNEVVIRRYCRLGSKPWKEFSKEKIELPEHKLIKEQVKEKLEKPEQKEWKEWKEIKEKPEQKELFEGGPGLPDPSPRDSGVSSGPNSGSVEERLARIEMLVGAAHFIDPSLRPDLSGGALLGEEDAAASQSSTDCQCR